MELAEGMRAIAGKVKKYSDRNMNEETTKHVLIEPFLELLGWNPHDPDDMEFERSVGLPKPAARIDIVPLRKGPEASEPPRSALLVECKAQKEPFDANASFQLRNYFTAEAKRETCIGVLTNGSKVQFFADFGKENIMDDEPFMEIDFSDYDEKCLPILKFLSKQDWDIDMLKEKVRESQLNDIIKTGLLNNQQKPSDELVAFFVKYCSAKIGHPISAEKVAALLGRILDGLAAVPQKMPPPLDGGAASVGASSQNVQTGKTKSSQEDLKRHLLEQYASDGRALHDKFLDKLREEIGTDGFWIKYLKVYATLLREKQKKKGFLSIDPQRQAVQIIINVPTGQLDFGNISPDRIQNVAGIGKHGVGNYRVKIECEEDIDMFMPLFVQAWEKAG